MRRKVFWLFQCAAALAGLALAGCGGTGAPGGAPPGAAARQVVRSMLDRSARSMAQSGVQPAGWGTSTGLGAGVGGAPLIGAFMHGAAGGLGGGRARHTRSREDPGSFSYDPLLGLWVATTEVPGLSRWLLYEDEGRAKPAGRIEMTWPTDFAFPQVCRGDYSITAGPMKGTHGTSVTTFNQDGSGEDSYEDTWEDGSHFAGQTRWSIEGGATWSIDWSLASGLTGKDTGRFGTDGTGTTHSETSDGHRADYWYHEDGSGSGLIEGPEPGLPARMTWTPEGHVRVVYADGTVEEYDWRDDRENEPI